MRVRRSLFALAATAAVAVAVLAQSEPTLPDGNYLLATGTPTFESRVAILRVEAKNGKPTFAVVHTGPAPAKGDAPEVKVTGVKVVGKSVAFTVERLGSKMEFDGFVDPKNPKQLIGTYGNEDRLSRATLTPTDKAELARTDMTSAATPPAPFDELAKLRQPAFDLQRKAAQSQDKAEQKQLRADAKKLLDAANDQAPEYYRKTLKELPDHGYAVVAAQSLLAVAAKIKAPADEVAAWAKVVEDAAKPYGPKLERYTRFTLAEMVAGQKGYEALALKYAEPAAADTTLSTARRSTILGVLLKLYEATGKADLAVKTKAEWEKVEHLLDEEYHAKVPPFKPTKFDGRPDAKNRVVLMELFTGTQCPPCVAADVGFDGLLKSYGPRDVVFLQYHEHIPGPDPLTNPDTVARMDYYREYFATGFGGTPSTVFNGRADAYAGGPMSAAERKYDQYRGILDKELDKATDVKLGGSAKQSGDKLTVSVEVAGMKEPKATVKLRLVLTEDTVKYVGSNGVRFHHRVVRSMIGGVGGVPVKDLKDGKHAATLDVAELRTKLKEYLEKYHADERPFSKPDRPLDLKGLRVVALVQDDETAEVLQAVEFEVGGA